MDLFDFFFPEQAQASHLRNIARSQRLMATSRPGPFDDHGDEVAELRQEVNFLTLVLAGLLKRLGETKTLSLDDLSDLLKEIDHLDGLSDGGLDPGVLRGLLGIVRSQDDEDESRKASNENEEFKIETGGARHRYRR